MYYYKHNIGDFNVATRHLTRVERSIYRDLIEFYYDIEGQLPLDVALIARKILASDDSTTVERMLNEFFNRTPTGYYHSRCEAEISSYKSGKTQKSAAGIASAAAREAKRQAALAGISTVVENPLNETSTNQEPLTTNHKIIKTVKKPDDATASDFDIFWKIFPKRPGASKVDAMKAFKARIKGGITVDEILSGTKRYADYCQKTGIDPQFIKHPATFLGTGLHFMADWFAPDPKPTNSAAPAFFDQVAATKKLLESYDKTEKALKPTNAPPLKSMITMREKNYD